MALLSTLVTCALLAVLLVLLYKYLARSYKYWEAQGLVEVKPYILFGSISIWLKPLHVLEQHLYNKLGRIYGRYDGQQPVLTVGDPELVKTILVRDFSIFPNHRDLRFKDPIVDNMLFILENEDWKRVRNAVSPAFTTSKLRKMLHLMKDGTDELMENLRSIARGNKPLDCQRLFGAFTMDVIARCAFGIKIESLKNPENIFVKKAKLLFISKLSWRTFVTVLFPYIMRLFRLSLINPNPIQFFRNTILQILEERKEAITEYDDFMQTVIAAEARDEVCEMRDRQIHECDVRPTTRISMKSLTHDELVAQCVTFFTAGYDSTTSLLSYALYNLAIHPECQDRAYQEVSVIVKGKEDSVTYDSVGEMKYLEAVFSECLRLCPPVVRLERRAADKYTLGTTNITVEKGMLVSIPVYAMHHDPEWYPNPTQFDPERFLNADSTRHPYTHLPFGGGPRLCIGKRFVLMEVKACLARVLLKFRVEPCSKTKIPLGFKVNHGVMVPNNVVVRLKERDN